MSCRVSERARRMAWTNAGGSLASSVGSRIEFALPPLGRLLTTCGGRVSAATRVVRELGGRLARAAPRMAPPTVPPRLRQDGIWLEAAPRDWRRKAAWPAG